MQRTLHDLGDSLSERPRDIQVTYSQHYCCKCKVYFNADMSDLALPKSHYTHRVVALAVRLVAEDGLPYRAASWHLWRDHRVFVPYATIQNWVEAGGEKAETHVAGEYLDAVLAEFSGYIAADELYDGPFCVLSIVDNRTFRRITYEVLDHDPTHADIERQFRRFQSLLEQRGLELKGITTDGSNLYPEPISKVFGDVPHQVCEFHVLKELTKAVLRAVAKVRKELAAAINIECCGTRLSSPPQNAKDRLPRSHAITHPRSDCTRHATRRTSTKSSTNHQNAARDSYANGRVNPQ
jgi:hypothetical protein